MNITETRIRLVTKDDSKLKAIATITIDGCMIVHDIKVVEGTDGLFIAMPSRKMPSGNTKILCIRLTPKRGKRSKISS